MYLSMEFRAELEFPRLDAKDYEILRELDVNFRQSFSKIGKKVNLSKNSVALRFEKLRPFLLHNIVGINTDVLGYTEVKLYYSFDFYNEDTETSIIAELKKHKNVIWVARYYGMYDICVCLLIKNIDELINQITKFNERFATKINQKDFQIVYKRYYFRYNFIHKDPVNKVYEVTKADKKVELSNIERNILKIIRYDPRISLVDISVKTGHTPKTIASRLKDLEHKKVISGYFMTIDPIKFRHNTFKILLQVKTQKTIDEFEKYLVTLKNVKYFIKMSGSWDYEIDLIYPTMIELQNQIEIIKQKFPNIMKKIAILSLGGRIFTNKEGLI